MSVSSEQSDASFLSSEGIGGSKGLSTRRSKPASQRVKSGMNTKVNDQVESSLRNESITVGIGLLCLFFFTYVVQYCARHGYIKIPEPEDVVAVTHDEL